MCVYICIYIYTLCIYTHVVYIYIYIYTYIHISHDDSNSNSKRAPPDDFGRALPEAPRSITIASANDFTITITITIATTIISQRWYRVSCFRAKLNIEVELSSILYYIILYYVILYSISM